MTQPTLSPEVAACLRDCHEALKYPAYELLRFKHRAVFALAADQPQSQERTGDSRGHETHSDNTQPGGVSAGREGPRWPHPELVDMLHDYGAAVRREEDNYRAGIESESSSWMEHARRWLIAWQTAQQAAGGESSVGESTDNPGTTETAARPTSVTPAASFTADDQEFRSRMENLSEREAIMMDGVELGGIKSEQQAAGTECGRAFSPAPEPKDD